VTKRGEYLKTQVLRILRRRSEPLSAYDILDEMRQTDVKMAPTTVYRALANLAETRSIHRLESLNAYVACQCENHHDASILSICDDCGAVGENIAPDLVDTLSSLLGKNGFSAQRHVIEVHGTCGMCNNKKAAI